MPTRTFGGTSIVPRPDYAAIVDVFDGHGEKVQEPGEVRLAVERGLRAVGRGQTALIDIWREPVTWETIRISNVDHRISNDEGVLVQHSTFCVRYSHPNLVS